MYEVRVHEEVFSRHPSFRRGIVLARRIDNHGPSAELEAMLAGAIEAAAAHPVDLKADPRILAWLQAHQAFGSNPNKFPPAHCSLLKRVQKGGARIPFISKVVAIMNYCSITGITPVGGDDVRNAGSSLVLRPATGTESFVPLDAPDTREQPNPGEIVYVVEESGEIMCRRWNWRNGFNTRITEDTDVIVMNIDGIGEGNEGNTLAIRDKVAELLTRFCGAETTTSLLGPTQQSYRFELD